jgi:hypothetical protein
VADQNYVVSFTGQLPGEALAIAIVNLIGKLADQQTPEQRMKLWDMYIQDTQNWRAFWAPLWELILPKK